MSGRVTFWALRARPVSVILVGIFALATAWVISFHAVRPVSTSLTERVAGRTVVIDAGHGGVDPGAIGPFGIQEKDVTLAVALELEQLLNRAAVHTVMTRTGDYDLADADAGRRKGQDLARRVEASRDGTVDLFISLHANSFPSPNYSGAQTFFFPNREVDRVLAEAIQGSLVRRLGPNRRQANSADYYVLREAPVPAVVVELGFLSHPSEGELLADETYQRRLAEAIYYGIVDYFALPAASSSGGVDVPVGAGLASVTVIPRSSELAPNEVLLFFPGLVDGMRDDTVATVWQLPDTALQGGLAVKAEATLRSLLAGPPQGSTLARIIPVDIEVRSLSFADDVLTVDFSGDLRDRFQGGAREERLLLESVIRTLGQFDGVEWVQIFIEGDAQTSVGGHLLLNQPFRVRREGRP